MKNLTIFPPCENMSTTISDLPRHLKGLDIEPEEIQRGEVADDNWGSWVIASIILGVELQPLTWSVQKKVYVIFYKGANYKVHIKNIDGLQRITKIDAFNKGLITLPKGLEIEWEHNEEYYGEKVVKIGGMSSLDLQSKYPELYEERYLNYQLRIDKYGVSGNYLTPQQETYLFKQVLNNGNVMNGQQWRNPTVSQIARVIRRDSRKLNSSEPLDIFTEEKYLGFDCKKMEYDELLAEIYHWVLYGTTKNPTKKGLDEMYDEPNFVDDIVGVHSFNHKYLKKINVKAKVDEVLDIMLGIIKDKQYKPAIDKASFRSLFMFCWLHITEFGSQIKFPHKKELKKVFFKGHTEMVDTSSLPKGTPRTAFGDALVSKSTMYKKLVASSWREKLNELDSNYDWKEDPTYNEN